MAILQSPGKLLALGNPVALKNSFGRGYTISVQADHATSLHLLSNMKRQLPTLTSRSLNDKRLLLTGTTDISLVRKLVGSLQYDRILGDFTYQVNSATLEEVFLDLNAEQPLSDSAVATVALPFSFATPLVESEKDIENIDAGSTSGTIPLALSPGRKGYGTITHLQDAWTIFLKRWIVVRKSWLLPLIAVAVVVCATTVPLTFIAGRTQSCAIVNRNRIVRPLTYPISAYPLAFSPVLAAPASYFSPLVSNFPFAERFIETVANNATFVSEFDRNLTSITFGGVSLATDQSQPSLFAWEGTGLLLKGLSALNLLTNGLLDQISPLPSNPFRITINFQYLASPSFTSTANAIEWLAFL